MSDSALIPQPAALHEVLHAAAAAAERGEPAVIATVVSRQGSTPSTPGQKLVLLSESAALGTVGGGAVEHAVLRVMLEALKTPGFQPRMETFRLGPSLGMCCGGQVDILVERLGHAHSVLIVGAGHVASALAPLLAGVGFHVTVCDTRQEAADPARFPTPKGVLRVVYTEHDDPALLDFVGDPSAASFLVMTHDHQLDQAAVEYALTKKFGFVGGVGSRAKAARTRARLEAKGFSAEDIARVHMPLGLDIGARSPAEIAVAVAGELIRRRAAPPHATPPVAPASAAPAAGPPAG
ncbi:MAG: XdhC family protein [Polyangiaceae bacterium]|nr:XdhC family protein [Polyangiaceae bacterium]